MRFKMIVFESIDKTLKSHSGDSYIKNKIKENKQRIYYRIMEILVYLTEKGIVLTPDVIDYHAKGYTKNYIKGFKEGREKVAKAMLDNSFSLDEIAKYTEIPIKELKKMK